MSAASTVLSMDVSAAHALGAAAAVAPAAAASPVAAAEALEATASPVSAFGATPENAAALDAVAPDVQLQRVRRRRVGNGGRAFATRAARARYFEAKERARALGIAFPPNPYYAAWEAFHMAEAERRKPACVNITVSSDGGETLAAALGDCDA